MIVGHAAVFDQWTTLIDCDWWTWREKIRAGAFSNALREKQDVRCLINHDSNLVLGRSTSGTLRLSEDNVGLLTETDPPDTQVARDLLVSMQRGDITQMSFAFCTRTSGGEVITTEKDGITTIDYGSSFATIWREGDKWIEERELIDLDISDVSIVTYAAYPQTDAAVRSAIEKHGREIQERFAGTPKRDRAERLLRLMQSS